MRKSRCSRTRRQAKRRPKNRRPRLTNNSKARISNLLHPQTITNWTRTWHPEMIDNTIYHTINFVTFWVECLWTHLLPTSKTSRPAWQWSTRITFVGSKEVNSEWLWLSTCRTVYLRGLAVILWLLLISGLSKIVGISFSFPCWDFRPSRGN